MEKKLGRRRFNLEKFKDGGEENNNFLERRGDVRARGGQTEQRLDPKRPHRSSGGGAFEWARRGCAIWPARVTQPRQESPEKWMPCLHERTIERDA